MCVLGKIDGAGGNRLFVEQHGGSVEPPEQTDIHTENFSGSLESAGLLQWLVFATVLKETAVLPPSSLTSHRLVFTY